MADFHPPVDLPSEEYVEIWNTSAYTIDATLFRLEGFGSPWDSVIISADEHIIISKSKSDFTEYGKVVEIASGSLTNSGEALVLRDHFENVIDSITYNLGLHTETEKIAGGYSIERSLQSQRCNGNSVWHSSSHPLGGSPGTPNSISQLTEIPPAAVRHSIRSESRLEIEFSQEIDKSTVVNSIKGFTGPPIDEISVNENYMALGFTEPIAFGKEYFLELSNLANCWGARLADTSIIISNGVSPGFNDLIITELMVEPSPTKGQLPEVEYIELYNTTSNHLMVKNLSIIRNNDKKAQVEEFNLPPEEFVLLIPKGSISQFPDSLNLIEVTGWDALPNDQGHISIYHDSILISHINYYSSLHTDDEHSGLSLERIDINNHCDLTPNWRSSQSDVSGTPGYINSIQNTVIQSPFVIQHAIAYNGTDIEITFNKTIKPKPFEPNDITINNLQTTLTIDSLTFKTIGITKSENISESQWLTVSLDAIEDCQGNPLMNSTLNTQVVKSAGFHDVIINEIMFDPLQSGGEYIELLNRSNKYINLKNWTIKRTDLDNTSQPKEVVLTSNNHLIKPMEIIVLVKDSTSFNATCINTHQFHLLESKQLFSLPNDGSIVELLDEAENTIDSVDYKPEDHHINLITTKGVSLERTLSLNKSWNSTTSNRGYKTPGRANSNFIENHSANNMINIENRAFSPNNDGWKDYCLIHINTQHSGSLGTISVLDLDGREITKLVSNKILSQQQTVIWDGTDGVSVLKAGLYILFTEIHQLNGRSIHDKKAILIGKM